MQKYDHQKQCKNRCPQCGKGSFGNEINDADDGRCCRECHCNDCGCDFDEVYPYGYTAYQKKD